MGKSDAQILKAAKTTDFGNDTWINLRGKTVYEAMRFCYKSKAFSLSYTKSLTMDALKKKGYTGKNNKKEIIDFLVSKKELDKLKIDYNQVFQGNYIKGKLRIQTYLLLEGYTKVD